MWENESFTVLARVGFESNLSHHSLSTLTTWPPVCRKSMDSVGIVHGQRPAGVLERKKEWTLIVHWFDGQSQGWLDPTVSTASMDNVHWVHGQCSLCYWASPPPFFYKAIQHIQFSMHVISISWHAMALGIYVHHYCGWWLRLNQLDEVIGSNKYPQSKSWAKIWK